MQDRRVGAPLAAPFSSWPRPFTAYFPDFFTAKDTLMPSFPSSFPLLAGPLLLALGLAALPAQAQDETFNLAWRGARQHGDGHRDHHH